jgi:hypothetical protein
MRRAAVVVLLGAIVVLACPKPREEVTKPADSVGSSKAVAEPPLVVAVTEPRCRNGAIVRVPSGDAGAGSDADLFGDHPGDSPSGGWGDGIGLGTVGTLGGSGARSGGKLTGQTLRVRGLEVEEAEKRLCDHFDELGQCFDDVGSSKVDYDGTLGLTLDVASDGHVEKATILAGTASGEKLEKCVLVVAGGLMFPQPTTKASVSYAIAVHRPARKKMVKMIETGTDVSGRLPPQVVKRIIRANFPRFRACYEAGLKKDPALKGIVSTKFVIGDTGAVESVKENGGSLGDPVVKTCVASVFKTMSFPEPEGGKVTVTYPIDFQNED